MAVNNNDNKVRYHLTLLLVVLVGPILIFLMDHTYRAEVARGGELHLKEAAATLHHQLSVTLNNFALVATDLRAFLLTQPHPPDHHAFAQFSATLLDHYPALDALVYVGPDRIIREIYPLAGNEGALGLDLSKRPAAPYVEKAIHERRLIIDPPHTMSDGRLAVIARQPIYRGDDFLGLAQVILHVPEIVQGELGGMDSRFDFQLRDENGQLFWGEEWDDRRAEVREVVVGNATWILLVAQKAPPEANGTLLALIRGGGGLMLLYILWSIRSGYRLRHALTAEVAHATYELRLRNAEMEQEIQQRQAAESKVRTSEQRLREAQRIAHIGNWEWDMINNRIYWSDEYYRIFGFTPQEFEPTFELLLQRVHPDDRELIHQGVTDAINNKLPYEPEHRIVRTDGAIRYVRASGIFECDAEGSPLRIAGTLQDITDQQLALNALEASEQKHRAVMEHASDGIIIASTEGQVLDVNRRIQTLLGYSRDELLTMHVSQIHPAEDAAKLRTAFASMHEHGFSLFEHLLLCKDGSTFPVEVAGTLISFGNRQVNLGVFRDIRERKRTEAELNRYRNHLEQLVEQRTAELVALNSELEAFSYSVTHDLRAPLRAISGFSAALTEDYASQLDAAGRDYLERINLATRRMGRLIDDMLRLSQTVRSQMRCERVSLSAVATELLSELHSAEPEREVRLIVADGISAVGDPMLLHSLLLNLLGNAWKFTRDQPDAQIEFGCTRQDGKELFFVRDNGIGFEMTQAQALFKPFVRLQGASDYEGSGIGLATVQRIVQRHGGEVWTVSQPNEGATFYFTLGMNPTGQAAIAAPVQHADLY